METVHDVGTCQIIRMAKSECVSDFVLNHGFETAARLEVRKIVCIEPHDTDDREQTRIPNKARTSAAEDVTRSIDLFEKHEYAHVIDDVVDRRVRHTTCG